WAVASVLVAGLIILFEYRLVVMLLPGLAILVWRLGQRRGFDRRAWAVTALAAGAGLVVAVLAVYLLPPRYGRWMTRILTNDLWDFPLLLNHFRVTLEALFLPGVIVMGVLGSIGWWRLRRSGQPATDIRLIALLVALAVLINWLAAAVRWPADEGVRIQNVLPASLVVCVLAGTGVGLFVRAFRPGWLSAAVLVAVPLLVLIAQFPTLAGLVNDRRIPNWQVVIREWADINLNAGTVIVYGGHQRTFNPFWGGIQGRQWFDWWPTSDILEYPLDEWVEQRGMSYALIPVPQQRQLEQTEAGQALLNRMLRLRDFVHPPARREPEGIFYRLWRMQHETNIRFGDHIILTGYDQSVENVHPGESVDFTFYWNAPTTPDNNYSLFIHLVPADEYTVLAQVDGAPAVPERLTLTWDDPGETLISPTFTLNIPADVPPGDYRVMIGLYQFESGVRLPVTDGDGGSPGDAYMLARLRVVP
ncbi:MAG TPA: hypothetical protein VKY59_07540, partial [Spirillospora sp.]|nr:hypothetical protein [Spirillospora sp.]